MGKFLEEIMEFSASVLGAVNHINQITMEMKAILTQYITVEIPQEEIQIQIYTLIRLVVKEV
jgi:hypothetical protein